MNARHGISGWLVQRAAASAPPSLRERLEEEWLADLQARRHPASRLLFGLGCCWAAQAIAREFPAAAFGASAAAGGATVIGYTHGPQRWSQRPGAMTVIIAIHVVVIITFANLFNPPRHERVPDRIKGTIIDVTPEKNLPPKGPNVHFSNATLGPIPLHSFNIPLDPSGVTVTTGPTEVGSDPAMTQSVVEPGGLGVGFPTAEEHYPAASKRLGEEGSAAVHVCVNASGRLTESPTIARSTGNQRLDTGALQLAQAGSGHYRAASENGRPIPSCFAFRVTFRLQ